MCARVLAAALGAPATAATASPAMVVVRTAATNRLAPGHRAAAAGVQAKWIDALRASLAVPAEPVWRLPHAPSGVPHIMVLLPSGLHAEVPLPPPPPTVAGELVVMDSPSGFTPTAMIEEPVLHHSAFPMLEGPLPSAASLDQSCSSVLKKRRRKMNRHKHKKWLKKMRYVIQRVKRG